MMSEQSQVLPEVHQTSWRTLPEHDVSREIIHSETVEENEESSCQDSGFDKTSDADTDSKVSLEASNVASSTENAAVTGGGDMGSGDHGDQDDGDDDTSLYVNPGDGGSRRASDLSTISGLNLDEFMIGSQPDTSDSCESPEKEMKDFDYSQVAREPAINDSLTDDGSGQPSFEQLVHKRNSAEIRNNIPELNQVKDCKFDDQGILDHLRTNKHGAIPKMKKQSPGVARRLPTHGSRVRDSSSSERDSLERDSILTEHPELVTRENGLAVDPSSVSNNVDRDDRYVCNGVPVAAVETTHSYVGARLAFGDDQVTKSPSHISMHGRPCLQQISAEEVEQTMTEIPLNDTVEDDRHALSTQTSEGESGDAESVVSDTAGGNGMPSVLDGLSDSREGSDIEEFLASPEGLKIQQQLEVESEQRQRHLVGERKEEVESALADIRSAIEKGKNTQLKCSQQESVNNEPVWVMRESYVERLQQQDILRQEREELEQAHEAECRRREMEKVREIEMEGDALLRGQQSRHHAGRVYRSPRGNDSDSDSNDEGHEHDQAIAGSWFRRKYAPVQTETDEQHEIRHKIHSSHKRSLANRHGQNAVNAGGQPRNSPSVNYDASVKSGYTPPGGVSHGPEEQSTHQSPSSRQTNGQSYHESGSECDSQKEDVAPTAYVERRKEGGRLAVAH